MMVTFVACVVAYSHGSGHEPYLVDVAGEIAAKLIRERLPNGQREKPGLLRRATALQLPKNPLVRPNHAFLTHADHITLAGSPSV